MRRTLKGGIIDEEGNKLELVVPQVTNNALSNTPQKLTVSATTITNGITSNSEAQTNKESLSIINQTAQYPRLTERPLRSKHSSVLNRYKKVASQ